MLKKLHKNLTGKANQDIVLIANAMFSQKDFPMQEAFVTSNKENFQCQSRSLDFSSPDEAADEINEWVNNKTKGNSGCQLQLYTETKLPSLNAVESQSVGIPSLKWVQKDWFYLRKGRLLHPCFGLFVYLATRLIVTYKIVFLFCMNTLKILQDCSKTSDLLMH